MALVPLDVARAGVLAMVAAARGRLAPVDVDLVSQPWLAVGCVLAADVVSSEMVPPFANSGVDGFAVQAIDVVGAMPGAAVVLKVVAEVMAGEGGVGIQLGAGEAVRTMTGAPIVDGADAVVMVERSSAGPRPGTVALDEAVVAGANVRRAGGDVQPGDVVLRAGDVLSPAAVGVLASVGLTRAQVHRRPRVGVLSTGDELVVGGGPLGPGQIRESNRPSLLACVAADGFEPVDLGVAPDRADAIRAAILDGAARCDLVVTSGGVSMGDVDLVRVILDELGQDGEGGGSFQWLQIAIKPAKPFAYGLVNGTPVLGLPGNPVSSLVSYECFARPALRLLAGHRDDDLLRPAVGAVAGPGGLGRRPDGKLHLVRVSGRWADGRLEVVPSGTQASNALTALAAADFLALVPDGDGVVEGEAVVVWPLA